MGADNLQSAICNVFTRRTFDFSEILMVVIRISRSNSYKKLLKKLEVGSQKDARGLATATLTEVQFCNGDKDSLPQNLRLLSCWGLKPTE